ncbi:uncharacterized protein LOC123697010 [Colias croceus]|uniref:uncharacterized protein LOC123697010 n=1 Tax=Colias crocea TaxID=72248 RepID=UPI001E27BA99|nr:uncharacterized protein LOC123697010 [Colias croceus]
MSKLCVLGCSREERKKLHVFPNPDKYPDKFKTWTEIVNKHTSTVLNRDYRKLRICDRHFTEADKNRNNRLSHSAVPSLFLPTSCPSTQLPNESLEDPKILDNEKIEQITNSDETPKSSMIVEHDYCFSTKQDLVLQKTTKTPSIITPTFKKKIYQTTLKNLRREVHRLRKENYTLMLRLKNAEELLYTYKEDKGVQTINDTSELDHMKPLKKKHCFIMTEEGVLHSVPHYA